MSRIANFVLGIANSIATLRGSTLRVRVTSEGAEYYFRAKDSEKEHWEDFYSNVGIYLGKSANPIKLDFEDMQEKGGIVNALDHSITSKSYETFMQQEALQRLFDIRGGSRDRMMYIMYGILAAQGIALVLLLAQYGG